MSKRRLIIYQKNINSKPIVLSDESNQSDKEIQDELKKVFDQKKIVVLGTEEDFLLVRPSEISAILVSAVNQEESTHEKNDKEESAELSTGNKETPAAKTSGKNSYVSSLSLSKKGTKQC